MVNLGARLKAFPYKNDNPTGFLIDLIQSHTIQGRFIEKIIQKSILRDPFGLETEVEQIEFKTVEFEFFDQYPFICLTNPPRSLQAFWTKLAEINNFDLTLEELNISLLGWITNLEKECKNKAIITSVALHDVLLEEKVHATVTVQEETDLRNFLFEFCKKHKCQPRKASLSLKVNQLQIKLTISRNGIASISQDSGLQLQVLVGKSIPPMLTN
jgi:hypothetical protein